MRSHTSYYQKRVVYDTIDYETSTSTGVKVNPSCSAWRVSVVTFVPVTNGTGLRTVVVTVTPGFRLDY